MIIFFFLLSFLVFINLCTSLVEDDDFLLKNTTIDEYSSNFLTSIPLLICQFGSNCKTSTDCMPGNKCNIISNYYSQCIPDVSSYLTANCIENYNVECSDTTKCCDPGAYCNHDKFRQCQQPVKNTGLCVDFIAPVSAPVSAPAPVPVLPAFVAL